MKDLEIFKNDKFGEIRTLEIDGKPYFVASDIAKALGYASRIMQFQCIVGLP